jgi:hypothetical protein
VLAKPSTLTRERSRLQLDQDLREALPRIDPDHGAIVRSVQLALVSVPPLPSRHGPDPHSRREVLPHRLICQTVIPARATSRST